MTLEFSDGVKFDTGGELRVEHRHDGAYVVGRGMLIPVADADDGNRTIERMEARRKGADGGGDE